MKDCLDFITASKFDPHENTKQSAREIGFVARSLSEGTVSRFSNRRVSQMAGARTFRRDAEIELLMRERENNIKRVPVDSVWHNPDLEPPAASIGNAVKWRPSAAAAAAGRTAAQPSVESPIPNQPAMNLADMADSENALPATRTLVRRPQVCSCCSQARVLGHARVCLHINKSCSRCQKAESN